MIRALKATVPRKVRWVRAHRAAIPRKLRGIHAPRTTTPRNLRWMHAPRAKIPRKLRWFRAPGPRPLVNYDRCTLPGPRPLVNYASPALPEPWGPLLGPPHEDPAKPSELVETSPKFMRTGRGTRETFSEFLRAGRSSASRSGLRTPLFVEDSAKSAPHLLFYEGKRGSADPVIYRGSEMGGQLSSSGHAKNALLELQIHTLPRNLSQNNSAGPSAVGAGGKPLKENPGPKPFPGIIPPALQSSKPGANS